MERRQLFIGHHLACMYVSEGVPFFPLNSFGGMVEVIQEDLDLLLLFLMNFIDFALKLFNPVIYLTMAGRSKIHPSLNHLANKNIIIVIIIDIHKDFLFDSIYNATFAINGDCHGKFIPSIHLWKPRTSFTTHFFL